MPTLLSPFGVSIAPDNNLYVVDRGRLAIFKLNLKTRTLTVISSESRGKGPQFIAPLNVIPLNKKTLAILDPGVGSIVQVDIKTGNRQLLPNSANPICQKIKTPRSFTKLLSGKLAVADVALTRIFLIDPKTGDCQLLKQPDNISLFVNPLALATTKQGNLLVLDNGIHTFAEIADKIKGQILISPNAKNSKLRFEMPLSLIAHNKLLYIADRATHSIYAIDYAGNRQLISGEKKGKGISLSAPVNLSIKNQTMYVADLGDRAIIQVNLKTGDRSVILQQQSADALHQLYLPMGVVTDKNGELYITDPHLVAVLKYANHSLNIVSSAGVGNGQIFITPEGITLKNDKLFVSDATTDTIVEVDQNNGNKTLFTAPQVGAGPILIDPISLTHVDNQLVLVDQGLNSVVMVDNEGNRIIISGPHRGTGLEISRPLGIYTIDKHHVIISNNGAVASILKVNLRTGDRRIISNNTHGKGPALEKMVGGVVYLNKLIYASDLNSVITITPTTGDRTVLSGKTAGKGLMYMNPLAMTTLNKDTLVNACYGAPLVILTNIHTGERTILLKGK